MQRQQVDNLVGIWLDVLLDASQDAGFAGQSILARMIQFGGDVPQGSGYFPQDVVMIAAAQYQRPKPQGYDVINGTIQQMLRKKQFQAHALLIKNGYVGLNPLTNMAFTHTDRAWILDVDVDEFKNALRAGYRSFSDIYNDLCQYEATK